jgi:hypothetical protein
MRGAKHLPGGRVELPTNPECFRGCSIIASDISPTADSFSSLTVAQVSSVVRVLAFFSSRQFPSPSLNASSSQYDPVDAAKSGRRGRPLNQCSVFRSSPVEYKPKPFEKLCQGGELNSRPRAYESPALPLSYPGVLWAEDSKKICATNPECFRGCSTTELPWRAAERFGAVLTPVNARRIDRWGAVTRVKERPGFQTLSSPRRDHVRIPLTRRTSLNLHSVRRSFSVCALQDDRKEARAVFGIWSLKLV